MVDLLDLISGDKPASQYLGEQLSGLIIGALLKRLGIAAAARLIDRLKPGRLRQLVRNLSEATGGITDRLLRRGWSEEELVALSTRLDSREAWHAVYDVAILYDNDTARRIVNNDLYFHAGAIEQVARTIRLAPIAPGLDDVVRRLVRQGDFGPPYELQRAIDHQRAGRRVLEYGDMVNVEFRRVVDFDAAGDPVFADELATRPLDGDVVLDGDEWLDAKHGTVQDWRTIAKPRAIALYNQILKAQAALEADDINIRRYRFEASGEIDRVVRDFAARYAPRVELAPNLGGGFP